MKRRGNVISPCDTVNTLPEMLIQTDSSVEDGETVWVRSTVAMYVYRINSGLTPDGVNVIASLYGLGVWQKMPASALGYTPATPALWNGVPTTVAEALDMIATLRANAQQFFKVATYAKLSELSVTGVDDGAWCAVRTVRRVYELETSTQPPDDLLYDTYPSASAGRIWRGL